MNLMEKLPEGMANGIKHAGVMLDVKKPEILLAGGIISVVGGAVLAGRGTLKAKAVLEERADSLDAVKQAKEADESYSQEDERKDLVTVNAKTAMGMGKAYGPAAGCMIVGIVMLVSAHNIQHTRLVAATAAYNSLLGIFNGYRERVREDAGEEKDLAYLNGTVEVEVEETVTTKSGKEKTVKKAVEVPRVGLEDVCHRIFDRDHSTEWVSPNQLDGYNKSFLEGQQAYFTQQLQSRGYVLLSEVYDSLGLKLEGCGEAMRLGWHICSENDDGFVSFGLENPANLGKRDFKELAEDGYWLEFNVDGDITAELNGSFR